MQSFVFWSLKKSVPNSEMDLIIQNSVKGEVTGADEIYPSRAVCIKIPKSVWKRSTAVS